MSEMSKAFWTEADMLPLERVMGKPEPFLSDQTGIGVGLELRCPHCGDLDLTFEVQPGLHHFGLRCKGSHVLALVVISTPGRSLLYLATPREPIK